MKILIAEDNSDDRKVLRQYIEHFGHDIIEAQNGKEGLEMASAHKPDLIISDALMPVMDGFQFLRNIKKDENMRSIPFVFYSAVYRGQKDIELALAIGAEAYIEKPKEPGVFWEEVKSIIERGFSILAPSEEFIAEEEDYLRKYSHVVVSKLEEKVSELEQLYKQLEVKNKELEQVLYATSHDLKTPLVNIDGFSKELQYSLEELQSELKKCELPQHAKESFDRILEDDIPESLKYITTSIEKMDVLLAGILAMSRLGRVELNKSKLDMERMIKTIIDTLATQIKDAKATVEITALPSCTADQSQINQVFTNIIENALKYFAPGRSGIVRISGVSKENESIYCVEDNGIGIAPAYQNQIFELFHQLDPDQNAGKGLGLTIARTIIERHQGRIWVESEQGKGTKFFVSLPVKY